MAYFLGRPVYCDVHRLPIYVFSEYREEATPFFRTGLG